MALRGPVRPETRLPLAAWHPLLDSLGEAVLLLDANGQVSFSNCAFFSARLLAAFSSEIFLSSRFFNNLSFCFFSAFNIVEFCFEPLVLVIPPQVTEAFPSASITVVTPCITALSALACANILFCPGTAPVKLNSTFLANSGSFAIFFRHSLERFITTLFSFPLIRLLPVLKVISGNFLHSFS